MDIKCICRWMDKGNIAFNSALSETREEWSLSNMAAPWKQNKLDTKREILFIVLNE